MMFVAQKNQNYKNLKNKEYFCYFFTTLNPSVNSNDPICKLISNFDEIRRIYNNNLKEDKKFFYFNKKNIHKILLEFNNILKIDDKEEIKLSELFYFSLLLVDNPNLFYYEISINYIRKINELIKENKNCSLKEIILSKIILILIYILKGQNNYEKEIEEIEKENISNVKKILKKLNYDININCDDFMTQKIDYIYMKIIISLINLNNFDQIENLIEELDLESINITETIFEGISNELNKEKYWKEYKINSFNDLKIEKKINFYYILLKYVLKTSLIAYRINFFVESRSFLLKSLNQNLSEIQNLIKEKKFGNKIEYIINDLFNSEYYYNCKINKNINKENQNEDLDKGMYDILISEKNDEDNENNAVNSNQIIDNNEDQNNKKEYSNNIFAECSHTKNIIVIEESIDVQIEIPIDKDIAMLLLQKSEIIIEINKSFIDMKLNNDNFNIPLNYDNLCQNVNYDKLIESKESDMNTKIIYKNYKNFLMFLNEIEKYINNSRIQFNPKIKLELEQEKSNININSKENHDIYTINCNYIFINQFKRQEELKFCDKNILINGIYGNNNMGFILLMNELSDEDYNGEKFIYNDKLKFKNLKNKENICYFFTTLNPSVNSNDPICKLISNFDEIRRIYNNNLKEDKKFFYFNKKNIHKILLEFNNILKIDDKEEIKLSELFYFSLLLVDNQNLIKYEISINYIKKINKLIEENKNYTRKEIILSKIILIFIYNLKRQNNYDKNNYGKEIKAMEKEYISIIKNKLEELKIDLDYKNYMTKKIDYIYMKIIISLFESNNFDKYEYCENIIKELELESINITETIFEGLSKELDNKSNIYWDKYKIEKLDDLRREKKINFYYILLKYILKNPFYIFNIEFLDTNRRNLLNLLRNNLFEIKKLCEEKKIEYIINKMTNSDYYLYSKIFKI